jgi:hypothetical protein
MEQEEPVAATSVAGLDDRRNQLGGPTEVFDYLARAT